MELLLAEFIDGKRGRFEKKPQRWLTNRELEPDGGEPAGE
jgi:hypothetical protein